MGHAGAIGDADDTAGKENYEVLGHVVDSPADIGKQVAALMGKLWTY